LKSENWSSKQSGKKISRELEGRDFLTIEDLKPFLTLHGEDINPITIRTRLNALRRRGILTPIGRGLYTLRELNDYSPEIDESLRQIYLKVRKQLPMTKICVWKPSWLNEFALHISSMRITVVESEKETERAVFEVLQEVLREGSSLAGPLVFLKPSPEEIDLYVSGKSPALVVGRLITEAPIKEIDGIVIPRLEKILVDLFVGEPILESLIGDEMDGIFRNAFDTYVINVDTMKRYARRRGREEELAKYLISGNLIHQIGGDIE